MTFFVNIWLNVSQVVLFVWFIVKISFVKKKRTVLITSSTILLRGSQHSPNFQFLGAMFTAWRCDVEVVLSQIKKTDEQNFPYFDSCRLIYNKINRLHKSTQEELLEKYW